MSDATTVPAVFDVCGELPTGTTVLEASAGTGKTFTIAALATRYVAEGLAELPELLLVTFGRMATAELRDRVRERLVSAERALRDPGTHHPDDQLVTHLLDCDSDDRSQRQQRLARALAQFDAATIATTHGFCQQVLRGLGTIADVDPDATLVPDVADLVEEVVDDLYLQRYAGAAEDFRLSAAVARRVGSEAVSDHHAAIEPAAAEPRSEVGHRVDFAHAVRAEVDRRKRARRVLSYDDLLTRLRDALADPESGPATAQRIGSRYRVVLVDEFQDTDPVQWEIFRRAFHGSSTLVLIGDPKQAVYAFRGADVVAYLQAAETAGSRATLGRSFRSDAPLLTALDAVFDGAALGDPRIVVGPVEPHHVERRIHGAGAPLRLRQVTREAFGVTASRNVKVAVARPLIAADVAADVVRQLQAGIEIDTRGVRRPLEPGDIAVLTRRNGDATAVREALAAAGVPAVQSALLSVFSTPAAAAWLDLLHALEQPGRAARVAAAALTPFLGWTPERLATADDDARDRLAGTVREWAAVLTGRGVAALVEVVTTDGLAARLLRTPSGERELTDLRHIGQALHRESVQSGLGPSALADWLRHRVEEASADYTDERSRRLESDAAAVQVVTIHASKGLEFPVVHVPFGWDRWEPEDPDPLQLHDTDDRRVLDVGGPDGPGYRERLVSHAAEARGEDLRLLYVALTRAASQLVVWWAPTTTSRGGALTRLLLGDRQPGQPPPDGVTPPTDAVVAARFTAMAERTGGAVGVETVAELSRPSRWTPPAADPVPLQVARFGRTFDLGWRRTSYTGLTAALHGQPPPPGVSAEHEATGVDDEVADPDAGLVTGTPAPPQEPVTPLSALPAGAAFGTLVHEVLETVDTTAVDLAAELAEHCARETTAHGGCVDPVALAEGLEPVLRTPLGPLAADRALADVVPADRLAEMEFELPLAGGDATSGGRVSAVLADVAELLRRELAADDPLAGYAHVLDTAPLRDEQLRGYLTGSLDAVLRVPGAGGAYRYLVVDYKTNRLAPPEVPVTASTYRPAALAEAMIDAHYPLQLLLYLVALHRFLRWRQPGYDPDVHLGGGLYLFVRGMVGPDTPVLDGDRCGVFGWRPPTSVVTGLSRLLDGQVPS